MSGTTDLSVNPTTSQAIEALLHADARFRRVFDGAAVGLALIDLTGTIIDCNPSFESMMHASRDLLLHRAIDSLAHGQDPLAPRRFFDELSAGKRDYFSVERQLVCPDGYQFWAHITISLVKSDEGAPQFTIALMEDITERKRTESELQDLLFTDELSGVYNRRGLYTLAMQQLRMAQRYRRTLSVLFIDLDNMKAINDTYGHQAGDQALLDTAQILKASFRDSDVVARLGGDEFVVLACETSAEFEPLLLARIHQQLAAHNAAPDCAVPLSMSVGVAHFDPAHPVSFDNLLHEADAQMYAQKREKGSRG